MSDARETPTLEADRGVDDGADHGADGGAGHEDAPRDRWSFLAPGLGLLVALVLVGLSMWLPTQLGQRVHVYTGLEGVWPLHGRWEARLGIGTAPAVLLGVAAVAYGQRVAEALPPRRLLAVAYVVTVLWFVALALVDGPDGLGSQLSDKFEYLPSVPRVSADLTGSLADWVSKIDRSAEGNWPPQIAAHPPLATLFFVVLYRLGLSGDLVAGPIVIAIGASTVPAVLLLLQRVGADAGARRIAPVLAVGPIAICSAVSADAVFMAVAAWGACLLAYAATSEGAARIRWALAAGLVLGCTVVLSYGLWLLGFVALAVLLATRSWRPLPWAAGAALVPLAVLTAFGFHLWEAFPALHERYYVGIARWRPARYWLYGNLGALVLSAGPAIGMGLGSWALALRRQGRRLWTDADVGLRMLVALPAAGVLCVAAADASLLSKSEVERIWLPFMPWLLVSVVWLPARWQRPALALQVVTALLVQHLVDVKW